MRSGNGLCTFAGRGQEAVRGGERAQRLRRESGRSVGQVGGATLAQVQQRHAEMPPEVQKQTAHAIAAGALRFFLLKFTRNAVIAFDFNDALSFEGETGPYCQYAVVRIRGIRRTGAEGGATR